MNYFKVNGEQEKLTYLKNPRWRAIEYSKNSSLLQFAMQYF